jgi:hypothetical protein
VQLKPDRGKKAAQGRINVKPPEVLNVSAVHGFGAALFALQGPGRGPRGARLVWIKLYPNNNNQHSTTMWRMQKQSKSGMRAPACMQRINLNNPKKMINFGACFNEIKVLGS